MARCRIYFFTYKRNNLINRAITSLLNQTFTDWICEVHNDCPEDAYPSKYINSLSDSRFILKNHESNLGPTKSFNLAYSGCNEDYASILEDDNWWENDFLKEMIYLLDERQDINIAWSNMTIWQELENDEWVDTKRTINPVNGYQEFDWAHPRQAMGALHSNGAMLYRGKAAPNYKIPDNSLFNAVELIRERTFDYPILFNSKALANFSLTKQTSQAKESWKWTGTQMMLIGSFIKASTADNTQIDDILSFYRKENKSSIINIFLSNCFFIKNRYLLKKFSLSEWLMITTWVAKNFFILGKLIQYINSNRDIYGFLLKNTERKNSKLLFIKK